MTKALLEWEPWTPTNWTTSWQASYRASQAEAVRHHATAAAQKDGTTGAAAPAAS